MSPENQGRCPHCQRPLVCWANPQLSTWSSEFQHVCFNDDCPYFVRGWQWMRERYNVTASYRYRLDPQSGQGGPLPVWSEEALKNGIIFEKDPPDA